jgi:hypothetical protein
MEITSEQRQAWFHGVTLDFRTLSGDAVPAKQDTDGHELVFEKAGWGPHIYRDISSGSIEPGANLDAPALLLLKVYELHPGTSYTLTAHLTLETSDGPLELVSDTVTIAIKEAYPSCDYCCGK